MESIKLRDEYIKLGQALKAAGAVGSGVEAKYAVESGLVRVNGRTEYQRGKKLRGGDIVTFESHTIKIEDGPAGLNRAPDARLRGAPCKTGQALPKNNRLERGNKNIHDN